MILALGPIVLGFVLAVLFTVMLAAEVVGKSALVFFKDISLFMHK